ncbi:MAG: AIR synthase-related protein [Candidatus Gracilibacteria bacterium]|nr:AIR synthase-related protein [Candidatus Gracilibacteria bacterium]
MPFRIEVRNTAEDTRASVRLARLRELGIAITALDLSEVYTIDKDFTDEQKEQIADMLANPVTQSFTYDKANAPADFDWAIEIGFLPGVTDNVANTTTQMVEDLLQVEFKKGGQEGVYTSQVYYLKGSLDEATCKQVGNTFSNSLIQRVHIKSKAEFEKAAGMDVVVPRVQLKEGVKVDEVSLEIPDGELKILGKQGIQDADGTRRGPLALSLQYLETIRDYFRAEKRNPKDIELESLAQTWSEHCKHTIFASPLDEIGEGLYKGCIKRATNEIRAAKGDQDFCVSVFTDNSGGIRFDENWIVTHKAETHNSPSALDPYGGAITGIVGVNRDCIGFGKGARPVMNCYGYCVGDPRDQEIIYRDEALTNPALSPRKILDGVVHGVHDGGNCSGIPTPQGFCYFDDRYKGKPLIFVGTVGLIPSKVNGKDSWKKTAQAGDLVVMLGGRVGQDGIHGATFSSEALSAGSPATAVQIGDPITQKKFSDAIVREARDLNLYNSITDNGAGGLSCSVAEMAKECGGCEVELEKVPLKYPNLEPWKIWISESQERMTLAVPIGKWEDFNDLMKRRGVEATVIGKFTDSGRCKVSYKGEEIMDLDMNFLHDGLPETRLSTTYTGPENKEPGFACPENLNETMLDMLARPNSTSYEFISSRYDHVVLGGHVLGPLHGPGRVNAEASVSLPVLDSRKAVVLSQGLHPRYSDLDTYHMAACSIDTAIRNAVAIGADVDYLAIMDNFCWCSSNDPERLGQLKAAAQSCYDYATAYGTPFISGKDSMFNDFQGFDKKGQAIKISVPPTLLISTIGVIPEVSKVQSMDLKFAGDLVYVIGETRAELGASDYYHYKGEGLGSRVPQVDAKAAYKLYQDFFQAMQQDLITSSLAVNIGGLGVALMKKAIAGLKGVEIELAKVKHEGIERDDYLLFSETQSRFVVSVNPANQEKFEELFGDRVSLIAKVRDDDKFIVKGLAGNEIVNLKVGEMHDTYHELFKNY